MCGKICWGTLCQDCVKKEKYKAKVSYARSYQRRKMNANKENL